MAHGDDAFLFVAIVRAGSLAGAGRALRIPPSTLSRRLAALERRLGVRLLERTTRTLTLTEVGEVYYGRCAPLADGLAEADVAAQSHGKAPRGSLRLSAPPVFGAYCLAGPLAEYATRYPTVRVQAVLSERAVDLRREGFDLAIRLGLPPGDAAYRVRRLGWSTRALCASPAYLQRAGRPHAAADLREHTLLGLGTGDADAAWTFVDAQRREVAVPVATRVRANSTLLLQELCRRGLGIGLLPRFLIRGDLASGALVELVLEVAPAPSEVLLLMLAGSAGTAKVRAFVELVQAMAAAGPPWQ